MSDPNPSCIPARRPDGFDAVMPAGRGGSKPAPPRPASPLDDFLIWLYHVTVKRTPTDEEVVSEAEKRGIEAERVAYDHSTASETIAFELNEKHGEQAVATVAIVLLLKGGRARARWPALYRASRPPKDCALYPSGS